MTEGKVINVKDHGKGKRQASKSDSKESNKVDPGHLRNHYWRQVIDGSMPISIGHPYHIWEPVPGIKHVLREDPVTRTVTLVCLEALADACLYASARQVSPDDKVMRLSPKTALTVAEYWRGTKERLPAEPKAVGWANETELVYNRLPWTFAPDYSEGACDTWNGLLGNMSNAHAFKLFIGSLFDPRANHHQYCWLHGPGQDGKGSIGRFLQKVFGNAFASKQPPSRGGDRFWTFGIVGKRLVVFPDCNNRGFVVSGIFKALTGGDPVEVEQKHSMSYTTILNARYIVMSNKRPTISSQKSDMRRIIYCEFQPREIVEDETFEQKLWAEGGAFLSVCIAEYAAHNPTHGTIKTDAAEAEALADESEGLMEAMLGCFKFEQLETLDTRRTWVKSATLWDTLRAKKYQRNEIADFLAWAERERGVRRVSVKEGSEVRHVYRYLSPLPVLTSVQDHY